MLSSQSRERTNNLNHGLSLSEITPEPETRSFICGWVGSGKSTLATVLLGSYSRLYPTHRIYIIDLKPRFKSARAEPGEPLFPEGYREQIVGTERVLWVNAETIDKPRAPEPGERGLLVHSHDTALALFDWIRHNSSVVEPSMVYLDESFDLMQGVRAVPSLRWCLTQSRERGVGLMIVNQRPSYIDASILTEGRYFYVGRLQREADRMKLAENSGVPDAWRHLRKPVQSRDFLLMDNEKETVNVFRLSGLE